MKRIRSLTSLTLAAGLLALAMAPVEASACHRRAARHACHVQAVYSASAYQAPIAAPQALTAAATTFTVADETAAFLSALNAWRASHGRSPLAWDADLAGWAAANVWSPFQPHSVRAPNSSQCSSAYPSLSASLNAWIASPSHAAILLNATTAVGASLCPGGATCNAR